MVTNYPQQLAAAAELTYEKTTDAVARAVGRFGQMMCGLRDTTRCCTSRGTA